LSPLGEDVLRQVDMFRRVGPEDRQHVLQVARVQRFARGAQIFQEGDPADTFLAIIAGRVKVFKAAPGGKEIILEIFGKGDPLGATAVYESRDLPASAVALEDTECLAIGRADFFSLLERHPALVRALLSGLTMRLVELTKRLAEMTSGRVEVRFARLFLKLAGQIGTPERGGIFVAMPLTRRELADLTGTTVETAIRTMSQWQKDEVMRTEKDGFVILNQRFLESVTED
jgi:CRP/FNR family transcriptional regulator, nitrogen oxide reductase regulator